MHAATNDDSIPRPKKKPMDVGIFSLTNTKTNKRRKVKDNVAAAAAAADNTFANGTGEGPDRLYL